MLDNPVTDRRINIRRTVRQVAQRWFCASPRQRKRDTTWWLEQTWSALVIDHSGVEILQTDTANCRKVNTNKESRFRCEFDFSSVPPDRATYWLLQVCGASFYWVADDGGFCKRSRTLTFATNSYTFEEVNLLAQVLNNKWKLDCSVYKQNSGFIIRTSAKSLPVLQALLAPHMPPMMMYKIGL